MGTVASEHHNILASGTVCTFRGDQLVVTFGPENGLGITLRFSEDESKKPRQVATAKDGMLDLELFNFTNVLGVGNTEPIEIGQVNVKKLFMNLRVYALTDSATKLVHYTIYQEK